MTRPRATLVSVDETPWYHCVSRCVHRAFLCGEYHFSGQNFDHRLNWIAERIKQLAGIFAIDVAEMAGVEELAKGYRVRLHNLF